MPDLDDAVALVGTHPRVRAVTAAGDLVGADWAVGGQARRPVEPRGAGPGRRGRAPSCTPPRRAPPRSPTSSPRPARRRQARSADVETALAARQAADRGRSAVAAELAELGAAARSAAAEAERHVAARVRAEGDLEQTQLALSRLEERLAEAEAAPVEEEPSTEARDRLRAEVAAARQGETEARLAVRTAEERARALHGRAESLRRQARQERAARERAAAARAARERGAAVAAAGARRRRDGARRARGLGRPGRAERDALASARTASEAELLEVRARVRAATADLDRLTDEVHRDEVARAEQRYRIEALEERAAEEYGVDLPDAARRVRAGRPGAAHAAAGRRRRGRGGARARPDALRPRGAGAPRGARRARPGHARQGQPAGAGGVRGAGGAARLPRHPARGPQVHPPRPAHRRPRGRRAHPRGLRRGLRRRRSASSRPSSRRCSPAGRAGWCSPSPTTC